MALAQEGASGGGWKQRPAAAGAGQQRRARRRYGQRRREGPKRQQRKVSEGFPSGLHTVLTCIYESNRIALVWQTQLLSSARAWVT